MRVNVFVTNLGFGGMLDCRNVLRENGPICQKEALKSKSVSLVAPKYRMAIRHKNVNDR